MCQQKGHRANSPQASRESDSSPGAVACAVRASGLVVSGSSVVAVEGRVMLGHKALSCSMPSTRALVCLPRRIAWVCTGIRGYSLPMVKVVRKKGDVAKTHKLESRWASQDTRARGENEGCRREQGTECPKKLTWLKFSVGFLLVMACHMVLFNFMRFTFYAVILALAPLLSVS